MEYKEETKKTYDLFVESFDEKFGVYFKTFLEREAAALQKFFMLLPDSPKVIDVGAGPGNQATYLQEQGCDMFCIDISEEMIKRCQQRGLKGQVMDFEKLEFQKNSFDGAVAYTSLLHIPKERFDSALQEIVRVLKKDGVLLISMQKGETEGFREQKKYPGTKRWFSLFTDGELRAYFDKYFIVEFFSVTSVDERHTFLNYVLKKRQ